MGNCGKLTGLIFACNRGDGEGYGSASLEAGHGATLSHTLMVEGGGYVVAREGVA